MISTESENQRKILTHENNVKVKVQPPPTVSTVHKGRHKIHWNMGWLLGFCMSPKKSRSSFSIARKVVTPFIFFGEKNPCPFTYFVKKVLAPFSVLVWKVFVFYYFLFVFVFLYSIRPCPLFFSRRESLSPIFYFLSKPLYFILQRKVVAPSSSEPRGASHPTFQ